MNRERVIIVGAGYAGVTAANRLSRTHDVTLVNGRDVFVDRVRLHELAAGSAACVTRPLADMVHPSVRIVVDRVDGLGPDDRRVHLASGGSLDTDHVVLATGSDTGGGVRTLEAATELGERLDGLRPGGLVRVLGAGATGVETAAEIAESHREVAVELVDPKGLLPQLTVEPATGTRLLRATRAALERLGVTVVPAATHPSDSPAPAGGCTSMVSEGADETVDCTGFTASPLATDEGLPCDALGRVLVTDELRVVGHQRLWAAGDCAAVASQPWVRMSCASATPMGAHVTDSIARSARGRAPRQFDAGFVGQCISVGRRDGLLALVDRRDQPTGRLVTGRAASLAKSLLVRLASAVPRLRWGRTWISGGAA